MQEALPAFVLNSETLPRKPMHDTPANPTNSSAQAEPQRPGMSDERLMLAFSQGSSEAFTELFHRYKQPVFGFFCRRVSDPANAEELTQETFFALIRADRKSTRLNSSHVSISYAVFCLKKKKNYKKKDAKSDTNLMK